MVNQAISFITAILSISAEPVLAQVPYSIRGVRESFGRIMIEPWLFGLVVLVLANAVVFLALWNRRRYRQAAADSGGDDSDKLFEDLLGRLELAPAEKKVLHELARGGRLQHPVMALLSPQLLDWSRRLWRRQRGYEIVTPQRWDQINEISVKLYDHGIPAEAK